MTLGSFNNNPASFDNQQRLHSALPAVNKQILQQARASAGFAAFEQMTQGSSGNDPNMNRTNSMFLGA